MAVQHVNRKGDTYYLLAGKTKTGKPKYFMSKKPDGMQVDAVPEGYEIHESPADALVHVRKVRTTRLLTFEREQVAQAIRRLAGLERFFVEVEGDSLVVYLPDTDGDRWVDRMGQALGASPARLQAMKEWTQTRCSYTAMLRFTLIDADGRLFSVDRWCFRSSIDNWFPLNCEEPLPKLLDIYAPHLGQESFFELM